MGCGWVGVLILALILPSHSQDPSESEELASTVLTLVQRTRDEANCTRISLAHINYDFTPASRQLYGHKTGLCVNAANVLNSVYQPTEFGSQTQLPFALVKGLVKDPLIVSAGVAIRDDAEDGDNDEDNDGGGRGGGGGGSSRRDDKLHGLYIPLAYRPQNGHVKTADFASVLDRVEGSGVAERGSRTDWFLKETVANPRAVAEAQANSSAIVWSSNHDGVWSKPFFDCGFTNTWLVAYSVPFYARARTRTLVVRGIVAVMFDVGSVDVNQCAQDRSLFADTHRCDRLTMQCHPITGQGLRSGSYTCSCRHGYFFRDYSNPRGWFNGSQVEAMAEEGEEFSLRNLHCVPCRSGCASCVDDSPCFVEYDVLLRGLPLGLQSFCITVTTVIALIVFRLRKNVAIASGMWTMLEMILFGSVLLYATVVCRYFEPTTLSCLLEPWLRELGFAFCYGAIVLKMYRILVEFRTRKAHRWVVRDKDLLKYLAAIVLVVSGYMAAWTALNVHLLQDGYSLLAVGHTPTGLRYVVCQSAWWEYVTEIGELLFLLFGVHLSYHARNAASDFREKRYLCLAIFIELLASISLHVLRHVLWLDLDPDYLFLMYFARCQATVTVILGLIFGPKLWYYHRPPRDSDPEHRGEHTVHETVKLQDGVTSNGEVDIGEINLADMDPEDIRAELRRVYTQLQILRNKTMRKDNPHISKRRGGRKATHRRFSLQAFHPRHRPPQNGDHEPETSKTPEESTASGEAPPDLEPPSSAPATTTPNLTFKGLQK